MVFAFDDLDIRAADAHSLDFEQDIVRIFDVGDGLFFENEIADILKNIGFHLIHNSSPCFLLLSNAHVCIIAEKNISNRGDPSSAKF
jgi:hypothetical protein